MPPSTVRIETIAPDALRSPYRGIATARETLRLTVSIAPRGMLPCEIMIDVDDTSVQVCDHASGQCFALGAIEQLFVVERQPPAWRFLTWFGVFARRRGRPDRLLLETPDGKVARFVERTIEERLGLRDEPVRGELRLAME
ncbi:MAG TPA: hypothetical protein VMZ53_06580 [Kofleriaceae bacterium]|nr:hypothetical protein [Kofleriaceae bacterium]